MAVSSFSIKEQARSPENGIYYVIILCFALSALNGMMGELISSNILLFIASLLLLLKSADYIVDYSSKFAKFMGIPAIFVGITVIAFGTSLPELVVSAMANWAGAPGLSIGNVVGSNISNICLVLAIAAMIVPIKVAREILDFDMPFLVIISILLPFLALALVPAAGSPFVLGLLAGIVLIVLFVYFMRKQLIGARDYIRRHPRDHKAYKLSWRKKAHRNRLLWIVTVIAISLSLLIISSSFLVESSSRLAGIFGVPEEIVGLTMIAVGTSLPELATNIIAARKRKLDLAIGNVVGSNIFNILMVLGFTAIISPIAINPLIQLLYIPIMTAITVLLFAMMKTRKTISRKEGVFLFAIYIAYLVTLAIVGVL